MKTFKMALATCLFLSLACVSFATDTKNSKEIKEDQGPYGDQIRNYTRFHGEILDEMNEKTMEQKKKNQELRATDIQLKTEFDHLQSNIEEKEESVYKLKGINEKLQKAQVSLQQQYGELEDLFNQQRVENKRLKEELEISKTSFYEKMVEFYEEEGKMLDERMDALKVRREEVTMKIAQIKENLTQQQVALDEALMDETDESIAEED